MKTENKQTLYFIIVILVILNILSLFKIYSDNSVEKNNEEILGFVNSNNVTLSEEDSKNVSEENKINKKIYVHISGAVRKPGLVEIEEGKRVKDVIDLANGTNPDADINKINLAKIVLDEEKIYIPRIGEVLEQNVLVDNSNASNLLNVPNQSSSQNKLLNINNASKEQLEELPGIGPKTAEKIIEYRRNNKFVTIEDLMEVSGIGEKKFEAIKDLICTN